MDDCIIFGGVPSTRFGMRIEEYPTYPVAEKILETYKVPGRSGSLLYDTETFENVIQPYRVYYKPEKGTTSYRLAGEVAEWLVGKRGYQRLEDSYRPEVYRMAVFQGAAEIAHFFAEYGRADLEFWCMPQRWLKSGEIKMPVKNGTRLFNPGRPALPLIRITGSGKGTLVVGTQEIRISSIPAGGLAIDCDAQNAFSGTQNKNSLITLSEKRFPVLPEGETRIGWSGGIRTVEIIPRWWTL